MLSELLILLLGRRLVRMVLLSVLLTRRLRLCWLMLTLELRFAFNRFRMVPLTRADGGILATAGSIRL